VVPVSRKRQNLHLNRTEDLISKVEFFVQTAPARVLLLKESALSAGRPIRRAKRKEMRGTPNFARKLMYELKIISQFAGAHQLRNFGGKCEELHGHNWKIEVYVTGNKLGEDGLLIDFALIKKETEKALGELDHKFLNELEPFKSANPSSENIARHIYGSLSKKLNNGNVRVSKVTAWESDTACATFTQT
jgi:6-pyruvoyltetrahydropterin/6-carboxytetrahydropterin synthase